ncbi:MAG TPA: substrate-binding domain-containing protein [Solirubrobacteraceae bacterium]|jgi:ABC-type phosphate transport system substrate-binding protein|nr:substrate-binding domain-containing protein [Solirubrobacteraceae bacterium]
MKVKIKLLGLLAICLVAAFATSGAAAGSASAAACLKVLTGKGHFEKRNNGTGECEGPSKAPEAWVKVKEEGGTLVAGKVYCFQVEPGEPSSFGNSTCTTEKSGTGEWVKVEMACASSFNIMGQGSSLQKFAQQEIWIPGSNCAVAYTSSGSGAGRKAFGEEKAGEALNTADTFIGTDEPLSETQMKNGDEAAKGKFSVENKGGEGQTIVIPVEQAAVAVIVNPPAKCKLEAITNKNLLEIWNGTITEWSQITGKIKGTEGGVAEEAEGCKKKITRYVRKDVSGTTFVFKTYLSEIEKIKALKKTGCTETWAELAKPENNQTWPESEKEPLVGKGKCGKLSPLFAAKTEGGGGEVKEVVEEEQGTKEGSIGYANLADARAKFTGANRYTWVKVENENGASSEGFWPGAGNKGGAKEPTAEKGRSNCKGTKYGTQPPVTVDDNWSGVSGANPGGKAGARNTNYPICTLTYDVALVNYTKAEYGPKAKELQAVTKEYLTYVVNGGQEKLEENDYLKVEEAVSTKAKELVEKI